MLSCVGGADLGIGGYRFLRFLEPDTAQADVARIGQTGPVVVDLSTATTPARHTATEQAISDAVGKFPRVLITDTEATEHIRPQEAENLVERLVVSNLLRAGRGQLTEPAAQAAVEVSRAGFDGAVTTEAGPVQAAVTLARSILDADLERRVEKSLQLLWWAGGGAPDDFPASLADDMELNPSDTREFLRMIFTGRPAHRRPRLLGPSRHGSPQSRRPQRACRSRCVVDNVQPDETRTWEVFANEDRGGNSCQVMSVQRQAQ